MRQYQPIWLALKQDFKITHKIEAPPELHKRIKKAVIKEKDLDNLWEKKKFFRLLFRFDGNYIYIRLVLRKELVRIAAGDYI